MPKLISLSEVTNNLQFVLILFLGLIFGILGDWFNLPLAWLLAPMIIGIIFTLVKGNAQNIPSSFNLVGQGIIAAVTASRFSLDTINLAMDYFLPIAMCISVTGSLSILNGYLIHKFTDIDLNTSFLGCIPGTGVSLVAISEDIGADTIAVAVLQYLRIFLVSLIVPIFAGLYCRNSLPESSLSIILKDSPTPTTLSLAINIVLITLIATTGIWLGKKIKLPSSSFLGPFLTCIVTFCLFPEIATIPPFIFTLGLFLLGLSIGVKFERQIVKKLFKAVIIDILLVLVLIVACLLIGYEFHLITKVDTMTAILGSTPGGISAMMGTVIELGGNSGLVLTMQMTRMLLILTLTPFLGVILPQPKKLA
jgi:membrane AbrB-like protein